MKVYKFSRSPVKWTQDVFLFTEFETLVQMLIAFIEELKPEEELVQPLKRLIEQKMIPTVINMMLKPRRPWWRLRMPQGLGAPIQYMELEETKEVLRDFFFLNRKSIEGLATTVTGFGINLAQAIQMVELMVQSPPTSFSTSSVKETTGA